jgi:hypothetical protein
VSAFLVAWNEAGDILATLDGLFMDGAYVDLLAAEASGRKMRDLWLVAGAIGSGTWPTNIGGEAHRYRVELDPEQPHRVVALVHRDTGERIERVVG